MPASALPKTMQALFGQWVRNERRRLGYTLEEFAERSGMSRPQLNRIELGQSGTSEASLPKLAHALGVGVEEIYRRYYGASVAMGESEELQHIFKAVPAEKRPVFLRAVRAMAEVV